MRTTKILLALFVASTLIISISCSKESEETHTLEYKIEGLDMFCIKVKYTDADGKTVTSNNPTADFAGNIKTITVTKPFVADLELFVDNTSIRGRIYELSIAVDGESKSNVSLVVPSFDTKSNSVDYVFK